MSSPGPCPPASTCTSSEPGQASCTRRANSGGLLRSARPSMSTPGIPARRAVPCTSSSSPATVRPAGACGGARGRRRGGMSYWSRAGRRGPRRPGYCALGVGDQPCGEGQRGGRPVEDDDGVPGPEPSRLRRCARGRMVVAPGDEDRVPAGKRLDAQATGPGQGRPRDGHPLGEHDQRAVPTDDPVEQGRRRRVRRGLQEYDRRFQGRGRSRCRCLCRYS